MSELLLIRHAETDMAGTFCGHSDPPINERGHEQLQRLLVDLRAMPIEAVYSSDLQRAASTASALATSFDQPVTLRPTLREIYFGDWEGLTWGEIEQRDPAYAKAWIAQYPELAAPRGEAFSDFKMRVLREMSSLSQRKERRIAVVTHAGVMRVALHELCGLDEQTAWKRTKPYCSSFLYVPNQGLLEESL